MKMRTIRFGLLLAVAAVAGAQAAPRLRCQLEQGGDSQQIDVAPVADPYQVRALDINGRFLFKAVVVGDDRHVDYISLYTYQQADRRPVLLHEAKYPAPATAAGQSLTGRQVLYAPGLGREFQYECRLIEVVP